MRCLLVAIAIFTAIVPCSAVRWGHSREILQDPFLEYTPNASWGFCGINTASNRSTEIHFNIFGAWIRWRGFNVQTPQDFSVEPFPLFINDKISRDFALRTDGFGTNGANFASDFLSDTGGLSLGFWAFSGDATLGMKLTFRVEQEELEFELSTVGDAVSLSYEGRGGDGDSVRRVLKCDEFGIRLSESGWHFIIWTFQSATGETVENDLIVNDQLICTSTQTNVSSLFQILSQDFTNQIGQMAVELDSIGIEGVTIYNYKLSDSQRTELFNCSAISPVVSDDTSITLPEFYSIVQQEPFPEASEFENSSSTRQRSFIMDVLFAITDSRNRGQIIGFSFMSIVLGALLAIVVKKLQSRRRRKLTATAIASPGPDLEEKRWSKLTDSDESLGEIEERSDLDSGNDEENMSPMGDYYPTEEHATEDSSKDVESYPGDTV